MRAYYERLGFERIGRSVFYGLCPNEARPQIKALNLPSSVWVHAGVLTQEAPKG